MERKVAHPQATPPLLFYPCSSKATFGISRENLDGRTEANPKSKICKKVTQKVEQNGKQNKENKSPDISFLTSYEGPN